MRALLIPTLLLTAACGERADKAPPKDPAAPQAASSAAATGDRQVFGRGRDRLCLAGEGGQAGVIVYGSGDTNCFARGRMTPGAGGALQFAPVGDDRCRILLQSEGGQEFVVASASPGCSYYCGPGASLAGKSFVRMDKNTPVTDIAGDPLC